MLEEDFEYFNKFGILVNVDYSNNKQSLDIFVRFYDDCFVSCMTFVTIEKLTQYSAFDFTDFIINKTIKEIKKTLLISETKCNEIKHQFWRKMIEKLVEFRVNNPYDNRLKFICYK